MSHRVLPKPATFFYCVCGRQADHDDKVNYKLNSTCVRFASYIQNYYIDTESSGCLGYTQVITVDKVCVFVRIVDLLAVGGIVIACRRVTIVASYSSATARAVIIISCNVTALASRRQIPIRLRRRLLWRWSLRPTLCGTEKSIIIIIRWWWWWLLRG